MRRQPGEGDGENNERDKDPTAGRIFTTAGPDAAASSETVGDRAGERENDNAGPRKMRKESDKIAPAPDHKSKDGNRPGDSEREVLNDLVAHAKTTGRNINRRANWPEPHGRISVLNNDQALRMQRDRRRVDRRDLDCGVGAIVGAVNGARYAADEPAGEDSSPGTASPTE